MTPAACAASSAPLVRQHVGEIDAVEVLHDEVGAAVLGRAEVGHVDDVRVADAGGGARLAPESFDQILLPRILRVQDLHGDALADLDVLARVDGPHAALAQHLEDAVPALDDTAREVGARRRRAAAQRFSRGRRRRDGGHLGGAAPHLRLRLGRGTRLRRAVPGDGRQHVREVLGGEADALAEQALALGLLLAHGVAAQRAQELGRTLGVGARRQARDDVGERLPHVLGRLVALLAHGRERAHDDGVELGRDPGGLRRRRLRARVAHERHRRRGVEVLQL